MEDLQRELAVLLMRHSTEQLSNTTDYILARFMLSCLDAFTVATIARDGWYLGNGHTHHLRERHD